MADLTNMLQAAAGGSTGAWDISTAVYNAAPVNWINAGARASSVFFNPDGDELYYIASDFDSVYTRGIASPWYLGGGTTTAVRTFSVASEDTSPVAVVFKTDGLKMYVLGTLNDAVYQYDLTTAYDTSTASYIQSFSVASQDTAPVAVFFKSDGTSMYIIGTTSDAVYQYNLSTAWDISTASYSTSKSVSTETTFPTKLYFRSDGLKMYVSGSSMYVYEYTLGTAWSLSTASYVQSYQAPTTFISTIDALYFKPDGTVMFLGGFNQGRFISIDLATAWDLSTASFTFPSDDYFLVTSEEANPKALFFKPDGTKMYIMGTTGDDVNEYDLSTAWNVATASYLQVFSVAAQELTPQGLFFKPDGTKMYVCGGSGDDVNEYDLSTPWDVSTASYLQRFSVSTQEINPQAVFFSPDGTNMYVMGSAGDDVNQYSLGTAWNVATASYVRVFSVAAQETSPLGLFFKPDGTKMYVSGTTSDAVYQYNLSTAWDISTASYLQTFSVAAQEFQPEDVFFKPDGLKMYIMGGSTDAVYAYDLG